MDKLKWYIVNKKYVSYLKKYDSLIEDIDYKNGIKPYIGIVIDVNGTKYYVPISSPKEKHYKMKERMDFIKIQYKGKILGVLNLNNMIPVIDVAVKPLIYSELERYRKFSSDKEKMQYISLLSIELNIINSNSEKIRKNALKVYKEKINNPNSNIALRSCNFKILEEKIKEI